MIKSINAITLLIVIVGGLNWAIVGIFDFNFVTVLFGTGSYDGDRSSATVSGAYAIIGLAAVWQIGVLLRSLTPRRD